MHKYLFAKKIIFTFFILAFLAILVYVIYRPNNLEIETTLINPIQIQSYGDCVYFLDTEEPARKIKKYENGKIYEAIPWLPKTFFKPEQYILGFAVIDENKLIILTRKYPEQPVQSIDDLPLITEHSFYLIDGNRKKTVHITSMTGTDGPSNYGQGQTFFDLDKDNNIYLPLHNKILKITPKGENVVLTSIDKLPPGILDTLLPSIDKDKISFRRIAVGPNNFFTLLSDGTYDSVIVEMDQEGNFIKSHDLNYAKSDSQFETSGNLLKLLKFYDGVIFIENYYELYKYDLKTKSLEKIFDEPLGDIHKWDVVDLAPTDDGYLLLVTDSDTGNCVYVWKLSDDNTLQMDYLSTSNSHEK